MESKPLRTCLIIAVGFIIIGLVFSAGVGVGYFTPRLLGLPTNTSGHCNLPLPGGITSPIRKK